MKSEAKVSNTHLEYDKNMIIKRKCHTNAKDFQSTVSSLFFFFFFNFYVSPVCSIPSFHLKTCFSWFKKSLFSKDYGVCVCKRSQTKKSVNFPHMRIKYLQNPKSFSNKEKLIDFLLLVFCDYKKVFSYR